MQIEEKKKIIEKNTHWITCNAMNRFSLETINVVRIKMLSLRRILIFCGIIYFVEGVCVCCCLFNKYYFVSITLYIDIDIDTDSISLCWSV